MTFWLAFECHLSSFCFKSVVEWLIIFSFYLDLKCRLVRRLNQFHSGMKCYHHHLILLRPGRRSLRRCCRLRALVFSFLFCYGALFVCQVQFFLILADLRVQNLRRRSLEQRYHVVSRLRQYQHAHHQNCLNPSSSYSLAPAQEQVWFCWLPSQLSLLFLISSMLYSF